MKSSFFRANVPIAAAAAAFVLLRAAEGRCASACAVRVVPGDAGPAWVAAARDLDRQLRATHDGGGCATIDILVAEDRTQLVFTTSDGRRAVRELAEPNEVAPSVQALQITLGPRSALAPGAESASPLADAHTDFTPAPLPTGREDRRAGGAVDVANKQPAAAAAPSGPAAGAAGIVGGFAGARTGGGLISPTVAAFGALHGGHWEFGVLAQWEIAYQRLQGSDETEWSATALSAGVLFGRREPVSSSLTCVVGANLMGAMTHQETHHLRPQQESTRAASRVGAYVGVVWPERSSVRIRAQLAGDFQPIPSAASDISANVPLLPTWAATLGIGVETGKEP